MSSASNYGSNHQSLWDDEAVANGTYRKIIQAAGSSDVALQWILRTTAGVASFTIYAALLSDVDTALEDTNPATNPAWTNQTAAGAVFPSLPAGAIGSDMMWLSPNPGFHHLLVEMVVTTPFERFSLVVRGQGRSG